MQCDDLFSYMNMTSTFRYNVLMNSLRNVRDGIRDLIHASICQTPLLSPCICVSTLNKDREHDAPGSGTMERMLPTQWL